MILNPKKTEGQFEFGCTTRCESLKSSSYDHYNQFNLTRQEKNRQTNKKKS